VNSILIMNAKKNLVSKCREIRSQNQKVLMYNGEGSTRKKKGREEDRDAE